MKNIIILLLILFTTTLSISQDVTPEPPFIRTPNKKFIVPAPAPFPFSKLDEKDEAKLMQKLNEENQVLYEEMVRMQEKNPDQFHLDLAQYNLERMELEHLKSMDPERYEIMKRKRELNTKSQNLVHDYRSATDELQKSNAKKELRQVLGELFVIREREKERKIEKLEKELNSLRNLVAARKGKKDQIIDRRLSEMLGEVETLKW